MTVPVPGPSGLQAGPYFGEAAESGSKVRSSGRDRIRGERLSLHQPEKRLMGSTGPSIFSKVPGDAHESCIDWDRSCPAKSVHGLRIATTQVKPYHFDVGLANKRKRARPSRSSGYWGAIGNPPADFRLPCSMLQGSDNRTLPIPTADLPRPGLR